MAGPKDADKTRALVIPQMVGLIGPDSMDARALHCRNICAATSAE